MASQQTLGSSYIVNSLKSSCWRFWTKIDFFFFIFQLMASGLLGKLGPAVHPGVARVSKNEFGLVTVPLP